MTIIIPIYNLHGYRFNNFCFLIKQLKGIGIDVVVYEQKTEQSHIVEKYLKRFNYVNYICNVIENEYFSKSILINRAFMQTNSDFIWIMDGDFFTDYSYVVDQVTNTPHNNYDFIRPFSSVVHLGKEETESLYSLSKIELQNTEYITNSQDGKYSFIVKSSVFESVGGMNEDFRGWGFQDLDFVQNRLNESHTKTFINSQAFHLYHDKANKNNAIFNRTLFENLGGDNRATNKRISVDKLQLSQNNLQIKHRERKKNIPTQINTTSTLKKTDKQECQPKRVWEVPAHGLICLDFLDEIHVNNPNVKKAIINEEPKLVYTRAGMRKTKIKKSSLTYYLKHIIKIYDDLNPNETLLFANNLFSKNKKDISLLKNVINNINLQKYEKNNAEFQLLFPKKTNFSKNKQTTTSGCFLISSNLVLKKSKNFYFNLQNEVNKMKIEDQYNILQNIHSIFY